MSELMCINNDFEGFSLTTLAYKGQPAWIAREVGAAIGYSQGGKRLASKITGDWSDEFIENHDFVMLEGDDLATFKAAVGDGTGSVPSKTNRAVLLLLEPGLHLALAKTNKPIGHRLRRFIVDEVLPQIVRDGAYLPERRVDGGRIVGRGMDVRAARERRLAMRLELDDRKFKVGTLRDVIDRLQDKVSAEAVTSLMVVAAEIALERDLSVLKPAVESDWVPPSEIADRLGVSSNRVGRAISALEIRGDIPGIAMPILNKAANSDRNVVSYLYSPKAAQQIEDHLRSQGYIAPHRSEP